VEGPLEATPGAAATTLLREAQFVVDAVERVVVRRELVFPLGTRSGVTPVASGVDFRGLAQQALAGGGDAVATTTYTPGGRTGAHTVPGSDETRLHYRFDEQGQLDHVDLPGGHRVDYAYDGHEVRTTTTTLKPQPGCVVDPQPADLVVTETSTRDALGRVVSSIDANGTVRQYAYDSRGLRRAELSPNGLRTFALDGFGRVVETTVDGTRSASNPGGIVSIGYEYDHNDNVVHAVDAIGRRSTSDYDGRDQLIRSAQPNAPVVEIHRRTDGLPEHVRRGGSAHADYGYDAAGRRTSTDWHDGADHVAQRFGYDGLGRVTWAHDSNLGGPTDRVAVTRSYDSLGRLLSERTAITDPSFDETITYRYSPDHRTKTLEHPLGAPTLDYVFDGEGRLVRIDRNGHRLLSRLHQGPGRTLETHYALEVHVDQPQPTIYNPDLVEAVRYDAAARPDWRSLWLQDVFVQNGQLLHIASSEWLGYDPATGSMQRRHIGSLSGVPGAADLGTVTVAPDGLDRLRTSTQEQGPDVDRFDFDWDGGNALHTIVETKTAGGATTTTTTTVTYPNWPDPRNRDDSSSVESRTWRFDGFGRLQRMEHRDRHHHHDRTRTFTYDPADRLVRAELEWIPLDYINRSEIEYLYDAFGRLVARAPHHNQWEIYTYDDNRCITEHAGGRPRWYIYDDEGRLVWYRRVDPPHETDVVPMVALDGSPWFVLRRRMDVTQLPPVGGSTAKARVEYVSTKLPLLVEELRATPFADDTIIRYDTSSGSLVATPVHEPLIPIVAGGRRIFLEEALVYHYRRYYDANLRAFITPDQLGGWFDPAALGNPRTFAGNNPAAMTDDGQIMWMLVFGGALFGAVVGGLVMAGHEVMEMVDGRRAWWDWDGEVIADAVLMGAAIGGLLATAPAAVQAWAATGLAAVGAVSVGVEVYRGEVGGWTAAYDIAVVALAARGASRARARVALARSRAYLPENARPVRPGSPGTALAASESRTAAVRPPGETGGLTPELTPKLAAARWERIRALRLRDVRTHLGAFEPSKVRDYVVRPADPQRAISLPLEIMIDVPFDEATGTFGPARGYIGAGDNRALTLLLRYGPDVTLGELPWPDVWVLRAPPRPMPDVDLIKLTSPLKILHHYLAYLDLVQRGGPLPSWQDTPATQEAIHTWWYWNRTR
jgi:YD repeat-containing protein